MRADHLASQCELDFSERFAKCFTGVVTEGLAREVAMVACHHVHVHPDGPVVRLLSWGLHQPDAATYDLRLNASEAVGLFDDGLLDCFGVRKILE